MPPSPPPKSYSSSKTSNANTLTRLLNLRTSLSRLFFWLNLPLSYLPIILTLTGHVEAWKRSLSADQQFYFSICAGVFGCWLVVSHTIGIFAAVEWELWWNPYAYYPMLRGKVDAEEEMRMLERNRRTARKVWNEIFGDR